MRSASRSICIAALALALGACAQGGGRPDGGSPGTDAGPSGADAGPGDPDSGSPEVDSGPVGVDSGPVGVDSGPVGVDSGPAEVDAGPSEPDAGPSGCTTAAECDDGLACNGVERCELGSCVAGTPPVCDDGVACTVDSCVEPASGTSPSCDYAPEDSRCASGQTCTASGCVDGCSESPCRLVSPQCGCASGQGCYLSGGSRLCTTAGTASEGSSCSGVASCAPGLVCLNLSQTTTAVNQCNRFCETDTDCTGDAICVYTLDDGSGGAVSGVRVCSSDCDPVTQVGCGSGAMCTIFSETMGLMRDFTGCTGPAGLGGQGAACTDAVDCQAGYACVGSPGTCLRWCDEPGSAFAPECPAGLTCYGFTTPLTVGGVEYGVCDL
jgi:hypothetical protein